MEYTYINNSNSLVQSIWKC